MKKRVTAFFSLPDILTAIALLVAAGLLIARLFSAAADISRLSGDMDAAVAKAVGVIERCKATGHAPHSEYYGSNWEQTQENTARFVLTAEGTIDGGLAYLHVTVKDMSKPDKPLADFTACVSE